MEEYGRTWGRQESRSGEEPVQSFLNYSASSLLSQEPLEWEWKATHSNILAWNIPWTEEPGGLMPVGLQKVGHNRVTEHALQSTSFLYGSMWVFRHSWKWEWSLEKAGSIVRIAIKEMREVLTGRRHRSSPWKQGWKRVPGRGDPGEESITGPLPGILQTQRQGKFLFLPWWHCEWSWEKVLSELEAY